VCVKFRKIDRMKRYFVTGIGTEVGKTIASAIITQALKADYWKPVQAGELDNSDRMKAEALIDNDRSKFHTEAYRLNQPMSPHAAAERDGVEIDISSIKMPNTNNHLVIEGAGGLLVPLNKKDTILDLIEALNCEIILVSRHYLGSINHTLMSIEILLNQPMSPHAAAERDGVEIDISSIKMPNTNNHLVIEGAGGLLVPLNDKDTILNLIETLNCEVILVSRHYLGSINHTLMSIEILKQRNIPIKGILFNGKENKDTESIITKMSGIEVLGRIDELDDLNKSVINSVAQNLKNKLI